MELLKSVLALIKREPARAIALVAALLTLGAAFGLHLGDQQQAAVMAVLQILVGEGIRSQVSPAA